MYYSYRTRCSRVTCQATVTKCHEMSADRLAVEAEIRG